MSDACTRTVSRSAIDDSRSINLKNIIVVRNMPKLGASLNNNFRSVFRIAICVEYRPEILG